MATAERDVTLKYVPRNTLPIEGTYLREDSSHYYTDCDGAICKWRKDWYHR